MRYIMLLICFAVLLAGCTSEVKVPVKPNCISDSGCVPAQCCHPTGCTSKDHAPDCTGIFCTEECAPNTLDCGQGRCVCDEGFCRAEFVSNS